MSKKSLDEKNNDFVSYKSSKIVFCRDGRIFSIDKDDEIVDLRDCENCKQKDQRIAELEEDLKMVAKQDAHKEHMNNLKLKQKIAELEKQLAIRDKALEIACDKIEDLRFENANICDYEYNETKTNIRIKLFLEQAEEALKKAEGENERI